MLTVGVTVIFAVDCPPGDQVYEYGDPPPAIVEEIVIEVPWHTVAEGVTARLTPVKGSADTVTVPVTEQPAAEVAIAV